MSQEEVDTSSFEVQNPPTDGISKIKFCHKETNLLVTSWDKSVRLYQIDHTKRFTRELLSYHHDASVLDGDISHDDSMIFSSGCDSKLKKCDTNSGEQMIVGSHNKPIKCIRYNKNKDIIITGSWDKTIKLWDYKNNKCMYKHPLNGKVFAMDTIDWNIIAGTSERSIYIFDIRNMSTPIEKDSSLKFQLRYICCHPDANQYIVSSIEGRVAVEYMNQDPQYQKKKYAFKCHRSTDKKTSLQTIYPVNCVSFHPIYKTFGTGGCDGVVNIWDGNNKKRITQLPKYNTSISSIDFSHDGKLLAISDSYTWEQGSIDHKNDRICVKMVKDIEVKPKNKRN